MMSRYLNWAVNQQFHLHCAYFSKCSFWLLEVISIKMYKEKVQRDSDSESLYLLWFQASSAPTAGGRQKDEFYLLRWDAFEND